nr:interferon gamma receptor 2 isoform X1 [Pogona vitticeps]
MRRLRMPLLLLWLWLCDLMLLLSAPAPESSVLPAPQNVRIESYNFKHVLRWSPVQNINGTVLSSIQRRVQSVEHWEDMNCTNIMKHECVFDTKPFCRIILRIRAEQGELRSAWSEAGPFQAAKDAILGPPRAINVTSEGNSILLRFLPPTEHSMNFDYVIYYGEKSSSINQKIHRQDTEIKFKNLKEMTEYCFQVQATLENKEGEISDLYCKETQTTETSRIISIVGIFGSLVTLTVAIFLCLLAIRKYKSVIKSLWQPPLRIPSHYEEDLLNAGMVMEDQFRNCTENDHSDTVSVTSNASLSQMQTNSSTNENQVHISEVEEHG